MNTVFIFHVTEASNATESSTTKTTHSDQTTPASAVSPSTTVSSAPGTEKCLKTTNQNVIKLKTFGSMNGLCAHISDLASQFDLSHISCPNRRKKEIKSYSDRSL